MRINPATLIAAAIAIPVFLAVMSQLGLSSAWITFGGLAAAVGAILVGEILIKKQTMTGAGEKSVRLATYGLTLLITGFVVWNNWSVGLPGFSFNQITIWLKGNVLTVSAVLAAVATIVALLVGIKGIWKDEAVITKWLVYIIASCGVVFTLYYVGTEAVFGTDASLQRSYHIDWLRNIFDVSQNTLLPPGQTVTPNNNAGGWFASFDMSWLLLVGAALTFIWALMPEKKGK